MGRLANSWEVVKASGRVLQRDKILLVLPILSFLASLAIAALAAGLLWQGGLLPRLSDPSGTVEPLAVLIAFAVYLVLAFVNVFFAAALVAGTAQSLTGGRPTLGSSIGAAARHAGRLAAWAVVTATVSLVLQGVRERGGLAGRLFSWLGAMAWSLATFFVVPVLVLEGARVRDAIGRSGTLFKRTWGEAVVGTGGAGLVFGAAFAVVAVAGILLFGAPRTPGWWIALGGLAAVLVLLATLQAAFNGVYRVALHRYATTGVPPAGFSPTQVQGAFAPR